MFRFLKAKEFSLRKSKKIWLSCLDRFAKKESKIPLAQKTLFIEKLHALEEALHKKNRPLASQRAQKLEKEFSLVFPKSFFEKFWNFTSSIFIALILAFVIRQMGLEPYKIPTGSMRPTLKEDDLLVVSKTQFGLNVPGKISHFYFDPTLVKRGHIFVFSCEDMDVFDPDMLYFYLFPGKKQFVKRLIGKPGDTLYFYGGRVFGIDAEGKPIKDFQEKVFSHLETIPMLQFEGKVRLQNDFLRLYQMNIPVAELAFDSTSLFFGRMISSEHTHASDLDELWGIGNYAMARILTEKQAKELYPDETFVEKTSFYLELRHHPSLKNLHLYHGKKVKPLISYQHSLLPLSPEALDRIFSHLYTCRFKIQDEKIFGLQRQPNLDLRDFFSEKTFPKGVFEIFNGKAFRIFPFGISHALSSDHFLNHKNPELLAFLFNYGIEFHEAFSPKSPVDEYFPARYVYYRNGDLLLLNGLLYSKEDPLLQKFVHHEQSQAKGFVDTPPPFTKEGTITSDFVQTHGLKIPQNHYLALGDNHAMSADSRVFGFVPEKNIKGTVACLFWPFSSRIGSLPQASLTWTNFSSIFVFFVTALSVTVYLLIRRKKGQKFQKGKP